MILCLIYYIFYIYMYYTCIYILLYMHICIYIYIHYGNIIHRRFTKTIKYNYKKNTLS